MFKKIKLLIKPFKIFGRVISQWFCLFFFLVSHILYAQIHVSDGATLYVAKDTLVSISKSEVKPNKAKIYIVSGTVVSNLETKESYDIVKISPIQTSSQLSEKRKKLDQKEKKVLAYKTVTQKKEIHRTKTFFTKGKSDFLGSSSAFHSNVSVLSNHETQDFCIDEKIVFSQSVSSYLEKLHKFYFYTENLFFSVSISPLLGRAPPLLS